LTRGTQLEAVDPPPDVVYREGGSEVVHIPGKVREAVYEVLFEQDNDQMSVSTMILDAIIKAIYFNLSSDIKLKLNSASELYQPSNCRLLAKRLPTFADRGCHVVSVTDPYGRILGFLDRSRYFSIK
jgi:hypothetical protein